MVSALANSGLSPKRLELEITESVFLAETEANLAILHQLRELGISISMDDFGTGYSSLSYLRSFPFDKIKIDRSFVKDLARRCDCVAIVRAISGLGRSLNITTTAEGVETVDQLAWLRAEGCNEVQGFLFSAARPAGRDRSAIVEIRQASVEGGIEPSKPRHDIRQRRARAVFARLGRRADMDQAGELFVRLQSEPVEHVAIEDEPAGQPAGAVTERGRRGDDVHRAGARRQFLLPRRHFGMRLGEADHADHQRRIGEAALLDLDIGRRRARIFPREHVCDDIAGAGRASPSNTMKRQGASLPWSGTRAPMVRMVSSSAGEGPGPVISRGFIERRVFSSSMASGICLLERAQRGGARGYRVNG